MLSSRLKLFLQRALTTNMSLHNEGIILSWIGWLNKSMSLNNPFFGKYYSVMAVKRLFIFVF